MMSDPIANIVVPAGLRVEIVCEGCCHHSMGFCDKPDEDEECILCLSGTTISESSDSDLIQEICACSDGGRKKMGQCVAVKNITWTQDDDLVTEDTLSSEDSEWFCPIKQITSGWKPVTYEVKGNELVMVDNNAS